jgi:hypothetical protein
MPPAPIAASILWAALAWLDVQALRGRRAPGEALLRGALAALGSGVAFWAISGIWTRPRPGGPHLVQHALSWTVAFLPGMLALLAERSSRPAAG